MSRAHLLVLVCACALIANAVVYSAPAPPRRAKVKDPIMDPEHSITIRRLPKYYYTAFYASLFPRFKFPNDDRVPYETFYDLKNKMEKHKR